MFPVRVLVVLLVLLLLKSALFVTSFVFLSVAEM